MFHERYLQTKFGDPSSSPFRVMVANSFIYMMKFTKLPFMTSKVDEGNPYTIASKFFRERYLPNLVILAHSLIK